MLSHGPTYRLCECSFANDHCCEQTSFPCQWNACRTPGLSRTGELYSAPPGDNAPRSPVSAAGLCWARDRAQTCAVGPPRDGPHAAIPAPRDATPLTRWCRAWLELAAGASPARRQPSRPPHESSPGLLPLWARPHRALMPGRRPRQPPRPGTRRRRHGRHAQSTRRADATKTPHGQAAAGWRHGRTYGGACVAEPHGTRRQAVRHPTSPSSSPGRGGRPLAPEGAGTRGRRPVSRRMACPLGTRRPHRGRRRSGLRKDLPGLVLPPAPVVPNASAQPPLEAGAKRTLKAVGCSARLCENAMFW
jgi:hypothetical protein